MQQKRMHVLILPSWYFPAGSQEIAGRMFQQLGKGLRSEGIEAGILFADFSRKQNFLKRQTYSVEDGLPTFRVSQWFPPKANTFLFTWWLRKVTRYVKQYIEQYGPPDVIHAQSYLTAAVAHKIKIQLHIPFIYTERLSSFLSGKIPLHHLPFIASIMADADIITCVSDGLRSKMQAIAEKPVEVIPNFFDETIFFPDPALQKNAVFTFIAVGEPAYTKGLDVLIKAFAVLKKNLPGHPFHLILADRIPEEQELKTLAEALGVAQDIVWTGLISPSAVAGLLRRSHVYVSASRVETFGKATIEAQACGLPAIATKTPGSVSIMQHDFQGKLCEIENANALAMQMEDVFTHFSLVDHEKIAHHALEHYGSNVILQKWISIYKSIAG